MQGAERGDEPLLLLHFDEEESGSQASQGNRQQTGLRCSSGIMHLKTMGGSAQGIKSLPHVPSEGSGGGEQTSRK